METTREQKIINVTEIAKTLWANKRKFVKPLAIVFIISCIYIFSQPRFYSTDAKLAPEMGSGMDGGTLGSIASAFGFNFGDMQSSDAINPLLYPDLLEDNAFVMKLSEIQVKTQDGEVQSNYFDYLRRFQKKPWWSGITSWISNLLGGKKNSDNAQHADPYALNKTQNNIALIIRRNIGMSVDKKTGVISINIKDQDPLICRTVCDSIIKHLQEFIIDYRTNKARVDLNYYTALVDSAYAEYLNAQQRFAHFSDANMGVVLQKYQTQQSKLENDIQLKYQTYTALVTQQQAAKVKVRERTPVFTILKGASRPIRPAGPKRMVFVFTMMLLTTVATAAYVVLKASGSSERSNSEEK